MTLYQIYIQIQMSLELRTRLKTIVKISFNLTLAEYIICLGNTVQPGTSEISDFF